MPTPPCSPDSTRPREHGDPSLQSTIELLDSLVAFYQHERMWVYRTRASLQASAIQDESDSPQSPSSTTSSDTESVVIKSEPGLSPPASPVLSSSPSSRWSRRKRGFKLQLEGKSSNRRPVPYSLKQSHSPSQSASHSRERILEMFEKMMEARMESCERVNRLVRNANRVDLYSR
ncbi:hypothetical protein BDN72DRAFT_831215 [Pluteus cervinus]|uniref:Uncharacterized protein n=1 Tax=Pluteus cervinus TaxID=181527 RepID=A0ACD3BDQ7_9AGAR|nr:hypothetical protein BDN72DRAFT_831215 [Pluteus cervinus]